MDKTNINYRNNKLKRIYENYLINTHKLNDLYYNDSRYRQLAEALYRALLTGVDRDRYEYMLIYLESFTRADFNLLCDLAETRRLNGLLDIFNKIVNVPKEDYDSL